MKKKIFITEEAADKLFKLNDIPQHLLDDVNNHKTSLGDNPSFPPADDMTYEHMLAMKRYEELRNEYPREESVEEKEKTLSSVVSEIERIERGNEHILEKLCFNIVNRLFSIPAGVVTFKCHISPNISEYDRVVRVKSEESPEMKFSSILQIKELRGEVFKRRMLNALTMGASITYSNLPKEFVGDVYEINPQLPSLYKQFNVLNNLLLFEKPLPEITEENKDQAGFVKVNLGNEEKRTIIEAYGKNFPILLTESIRGFMELFASHGLPEDKKECDFVIKKADFLAAEPWDMRLGPVMWKSLIKSIGDLETRYLPLVFTELSELKGENFSYIMSEILAGTDEGDNLLKSIVSDAKNEIDYDDFKDTLVQKDMNKNMIADEYIRADELDSL